YAPINTGYFSVANLVITFTQDTVGAENITVRYSGNGCVHGVYHLRVCSPLSDQREGWGTSCVCSVPSVRLKARSLAMITAPSKVALTLCVEARKYMCGMC